MNLPSQTPKHLSLAEEKNLKEKIQFLRDAKDEVEVNGAQGVRHEVRDMKAVDEKLARLEKIQREQSIERAVGQEREELEKEEKALRTKLDPGMTWDEYSGTRARDGMRFLKLVNQIGKWNGDKQRQQDIDRWKYVRRRLDPEDPHVSNTMNLFRD